MFGTSSKRAKERGGQGRSMVVNDGGIVSSENPMASQIAVQILQAGGSAVDAAIAANAAMTVLAPMKCGLGGDLFAIVYDAKSGELHGMNGSGWSPEKLSFDLLQKDSFQSMPLHHIHAGIVTVPGVVDAWEKLSQKFGRLPLSQCLAPSISLAEEGIAVTEWVSIYWEAEKEMLSKNDESSRLFLLPSDEEGEKKTPEMGTMFKNPDVAHTLRLISKNGSRGFYEGETAEKIVKCSQELGGVMSMEDLKEYSSEWVVPLSTMYRDWRVYELPPNGQGVAALMMLNIMENFPIPKMGHNTPETLHVQIESKNYAYADMLQYTADLLKSKVPVEEMTSKEYGLKRSREISPEKTNERPMPYSFSEGSDTTYLSCVDKDGNMVSLIQSLYTSFGSGITPKGSGFCLQNRGNLFSLDPTHPNFIEGRKRPLHTIIPGFMEKDNQKIAFGIMGGWNQAQAHAQFVSNVVDHQMNIQAALEAPRFSKHNFQGAEVCIEDGMAPHVSKDLAARGHQVNVLSRFSAMMGGGQAVMRSFDQGVNFGASDPRKDGAAIPQQPSF